MTQAFHRDRQLNYMASIMGVGQVWYLYSLVECSKVFNVSFKLSKFVQKINNVRSSDLMPLKSN